MIGRINLFDIVDNLLSLGVVVTLSPYKRHNEIDIILAYMPELCDNRNIRFSFKEDKGIIIHYADEDFAYAEYNGYNEFINYVKEYLGIV